VKKKGDGEKKKESEFDGPIWCQGGGGNPKSMRGRKAFYAKTVIFRKTGRKTPAKEKKTGEEKTRELVGIRRIV